MTRGLGKACMPARQMRGLQPDLVRVDRLRNSRQGSL